MASSRQDFWAKRKEEELSQGQRIQRGIRTSRRRGKSNKTHGST